MGEALFPEHKPFDFLMERKSLLTEASWESIYQQHPIVVGGGQLPIDKMKVVPQFDRSNVTNTVRYWDKAGTADSEDAAYTAGVRMHAMSDGTYVISHIVRGQWSALDRETRIKTWTEADAAEFGSYEVYVEQEPGSGGKESAEGTIRNLAGHRVYADRVTGAKEIRAEPFAAQVQGGNVSLVAGEWVGDFYDECECLDKSTVITTMRGDQRIEDVAVGDLVMTRLGWRRVLKAGRVGRNRLCEITLSNGRRLRTTLDHPIFVPGCGFKKAATLKVGESLLQFTGDGLSGFRATATSGDGSTVGRKSSTVISGSMRLVRSLQVITSTMWTAIGRTIIRSPTLNVFMLAFTSRYRIARSAASAWFAAARSMPQLEGTLAFVRPGALTVRTQIASASMISNALPAAKHTAAGRSPDFAGSFAKLWDVAAKERRSERGHVSNAVSVSSQITLNPKKDFAVNAVQVLGLRMLDGIHDVYNLSVEEAPEFVAEGVLVHNSWPGGKRKDQVDAAAGAFAKLATGTAYLTDYSKWL